MITVNHPNKTSIVSSSSTASTFARALWWRLTREGFGLALVLPLAFGVLVELAAVVLPVVSVEEGAIGPTHPGYNGVAISVDVLGATSSNEAALLVLLALPLVISIAAGLAAAISVSLILGSELNAGSAELWLSRLSPHSIIIGLLRVVGTLVLLVCVSMLLFSGILLVVLLLTLTASVSLTAGYVLLCTFVPLVLALSGAAMAVGVGLWKPKLAQVSSGLIHGPGVTLVLVAFAPCLVVALATALLFGLGVSIFASGGIGVGTAILLAILAGYVGSTRVSRDSIVSSL